ncbi:DUF4127 family protein [bacterium]|nr:DUF4127 family protein [bacterium]
MKIAVIPIDNRPICYDIIEDILNQDTSIELFMPDIKDLGGLNHNSNINAIFEFIKNLPCVDYFIVSLDTVAYGGLISSRRTNENFDVIQKRMEEFKSLVEQKGCKTLAFSSIMRISNNNINEEEKEYWAQWGKRIFEWSYWLHKSEKEQTHNCVLNKIPDDILEDYLSSRKRNFEINKMYLKWAKSGFFDTLIYSKDDCAEYGLNIKEAQELENLSKNLNNVFVKTGADEIPLSLISRALNRNLNEKINLVFSYPQSTNLISKYEDVSILNCAKGQISLAGLECDENANYTFLINNFETEQGDLVLGDKINITKSPKKFFQLPYFIADVNNANGADDGFIRQLFLEKTDNFFGYCAYNTSANTIGCALLNFIVKLRAQKQNTYNHSAFLKIQFIRFLDDWAYQAKIRKNIKNSLDFKQALIENIPKLNILAKDISKFLNFYPKEITYSLPWERSFEIRIRVRE